jgi:hypothetical protein
MGPDSVYIATINGVATAYQVGVNEVASITITVTEGVASLQITYDSGEVWDIFNSPILVKSPPGP